MPAINVQHMILAAVGRIWSDGKVDPFTAVSALVIREGVKKVVAALGGDQSAQDLASQLVADLRQSESDVAERLARIDDKLDIIVEQRYKTAIAAGVRALQDALAAHRSEDRREELKRARKEFTDAVAAAKDALQKAIAERYLLLCAIGLGRQDAADIARAHFYAHVTGAVLELDESRWSAKLEYSKQYEAIRKKYDSYQVARARMSRAKAAQIANFEEYEAAKGLIGAVLHEVDLLSPRPGSAGPSVIAMEPVVQGEEAWIHGSWPLWEGYFRPPQVLRFGALTLDWRELSPGSHHDPPPTRPVGRRFPASVRRPVKEVRPGSIFDVDIEIWANPVLNRDLPVNLWDLWDEAEIRPPLTPWWDRTPTCHAVLPAGENSLRIQRGVLTGRNGHLRLTLGHNAVRLHASQ